MAALDIGFGALNQRHQARRAAQKLLRPSQTTIIAKTFVICDLPMKRLAAAFILSIPL